MNVWYFPTLSCFPFMVCGAVRGCGFLPLRDAKAANLDVRWEEDMVTAHNRLGNTILSSLILCLVEVVNLLEIEQSFLKSYWYIICIRSISKERSPWIVVENSPLTKMDIVTHTYRETCNGPTEAGFYPLWIWVLCILQQ